MEPVSLVLQPQLQCVQSLVKQIGSKDEMLDLTVIAPMVQAGEGAMVTQSRVPEAPIIVDRPQSAVSRRTRHATAMPADQVSTTLGTRLAELVSDLDWPLAVWVGE